MSNVLDRANIAELIQALKAAEGPCLVIPCRYRFRFNREDFGGAYVLEIERLPPVENESNLLQRLADHIMYSCDPDRTEPLDLLTKVDGKQFRIQVTHVDSSEVIDGAIQDEA